MRDVLHAEDLVKLYRRAYECRDALHGEIFNIGGGLANSLSLLELFEILSRLLDIPSLVCERTARRASDQDCFIASITKAQRLLEWAPQVTCEGGISAMLKWCNTYLNLN